MPRTHAPRLAILLMWLLQGTQTQENPGLMPKHPEGNKESLTPPPQDEAHKSDTVEWKLLAIIPVQNLQVIVMEAMAGQDRLCGIYYHGYKNKAVQWGEDECTITVSKEPNGWPMEGKFGTQRVPQLRYLVVAAWKDAPAKPDSYELRQMGVKPEQNRTPATVTSAPRSGKIRQYIPSQSLTKGMVFREIQVRENLTSDFWDSLMCDWRSHYLKGVSSRYAEYCGLKVYPTRDWWWILEVSAPVISPGGTYVLDFISRNKVGKTVRIQIHWDDLETLKDEDFPLDGRMSDEGPHPPAPTTTKTNVLVTTEARYKAKQRSVQSTGDEAWERASQNGWYKWAWYTVRQMTADECLLCAEAPTTLPTVIPEKHTFEGCAKVQQRECREGRFTPASGGVKIFQLPICGIQCRLIHGSRRSHHLLRPYVQSHEACAEFQISTPQNEPPTDYKIDRAAEYECFASGGFSDAAQNLNGSSVGNVSVHCNVTWVLSWFPHANMTPVFVSRPVWYEHPVPLDQTCHDITMTVPTVHLLLEQTLAVADSFWMCGGDTLLNRLPPRWIGLCTLVRMKVPVQMVYKGLEDIIGVKEPLDKRSMPVSRVRLDATMRPQGIPEEFKARNEVKAGSSSLPKITTSKNVDWINYIYYNQQRFINHTDEALSALGQPLEGNSRTRLEYRQALSWMLAERGRVCHMFGDRCCTYVPGSAAPDGSFSRAMSKLWELRQELGDAAAKKDWLWGGLDWQPGDWNGNLARMGMAALFFMGMLLVTACCLVPILRRVHSTAVTGQI